MGALTKRERRRGCLNGSLGPVRGYVPAGFKAVDAPAIDALI